ncbi:adenosine deaminase [Sulfobacillus thermosulfidooxidans]|uniref:adenosine deaminase n=1 Tax=Sulfobacillus thermosulfidooxidans TaxID=28034 RepID=UPI0002E056F0|nr:adenosine deaminase [Sulfobacillus thermosulfidooxidans]
MRPFPNPHEPWAQDKVELHMHLEGCLEPDLWNKFQRKHSYLDIAPVTTVTYPFTDLSSFLAWRYQGDRLLNDEEDFFDLTWRYVQRALDNHIVYAEIFFDPQAHTARGVSLDTVMSGIIRALRQAEQRYGWTARLIPNILRDHPLRTAEDDLAHLEAYGDWIVGVGLDSRELPYPPRLFRHLFDQVRRKGWHVVAHAGEEGPASYIWEALDELGAERIDHGIHAMDDPVLMDRLKIDRIPLTICPWSNKRLGVTTDLSIYYKLFHEGLVLTINSDDPAYFSSYLNANFELISPYFPPDALQQLIENSFVASFRTEF